MPQPSRESQRLFAATAFIALALCVMIYHQAGKLTFVHEYSKITFLEPSGLAQYRFMTIPSKVGAFDLKRSWAGRILSLQMGYYMFTSPSLEDGKLDQEEFAHEVGLYAAFWLGLTFLLYLLSFGDHALLPILGTYVAVSFGYMPGIADRIYPWDLPPLFFYTLLVCLLIRQRLIYLIPILPLAVLFKETAILLPLAFLFGPQPLARRLRLFAIAMTLAATTRYLATLATGTTGGAPIKWQLPLTNLEFLYTMKFPNPYWYIFDYRWFNHPVLIDAGLLVAFLIVRCDGEHIAPLRCIFWVFTLLTFIFGIIFEYRIWFELIPICLYPFYYRQLEPAPAGAGGENPGCRNGGAML